jgi:hypothetical protein
MKSISNRILVITLAVCALSVFASSHMARMHGQEKVQRPAGVGEELPGRAQSQAPIIYGNQTPFGELPDTLVEPSSVLQSDPIQDKTQVVQRQSYDLPPNQTEGILPGRETSDPGSLELVESTQVVGTPVPQIGTPLSVTPAPPIANIAPVPVASLNIPPATACQHCGLKTCVICCQPKCITKTIMVPQYHTVWSSIFETRYRTEIKEEAYTVEQEVDHQVPRVIQETVMVPEPRIRTFQDFREEEYQVPVEEPYSVMVRKPRQRMVPVEREETYRYPEEQEYTEMVPEEKIVTETKYKTIIDKEPRQKKYTVDVERQKKRVVIDYVEQDFTLTKREPITRIEKKKYTRPEWIYENVTRTEIIKEPYVEYVQEIRPYRLLKPQVVESSRNVEVDEIQYENKSGTYQQPKVEQVEVDKQIPQTYTVAVPYVSKAYENFTKSVPYEEDVVVSWKSRKQVPREVKRQYSVKIPYIENIPRQYKVKIPVQVMKKGMRTVPKQIPRTKYQTVKRDMGKWVTSVATIPTYEIESDRCGCSTCCPKTRSVRKTVWQPNIVASRIPYTVYETVKKEVPYEYPVLEHRFETRDRMEPVTRYRTEPREVTLTVYDVKPATETKTVKVRRFKQVPDRREITIQKFREEKRTRMVDIQEYANKETSSPFKVDYEDPKVAKKPIRETFTTLGVDAEGPRIEPKVLVPEVRYRDKEVSFVVRVPKRIDVPYEEEVEIKDFVNVEKVIKVQVPIPRIEEYVVTAPEIRTRIEYVDVEKRVPYVETKTITEMVPAKRTRTIYKTDVRTVAELKPEVYFEDVKEVFTRTVYKKKFRNVPVNRAEIYWVKVPKVLKKTIFKTVTRTIKRPALRRVPVRVPYQVEVRIPRRVCTMVPQTITIAVEECCEHCAWHLPGVATATNAWLEYGREQAENMFWWVREE